MGLAVLVICFFTFMVMGVPIAFNLLVSTCAYILTSGYNLVVVGQKMFEGMYSFSFLAVPFFVLTGQLMLRGGLLDDLINFVNVYFGRFKGAIAMVTIGASLLMGSIVGLAVASAASLGAFLIPMMKKEGYSPAFASATMSSAALLGPIMPPSVLMIIYCSAVGSTSIAGLFMASVIPAILMAAAMIIVANRIASKRGYPSYGKTTISEKLKATMRALPAMFLPVIILGGIFSGVFSITEASAVAVLYSAIIAFFLKKSVTIKDVPELVMETTSTTGLVLILAGAGRAMAWTIANERVLDSLIGPMSNMPTWAFLLLVNAILLVAGCFMDDYASVVILAPLIAPIGWALGVNPLQMGAIICINLVIGLATPPFGITLFVTSPTAGVTVEQTVREAIPYLAVLIAILLMITFIPAITTTLPRMAGYI